MEGKTRKTWSRQIERIRSQLGDHPRVVQPEIPRALSTARGEVDSAFRGCRAEGGPARVLADRAAVAVLPSRLTALLRDYEALRSLDQRSILLKEPSASNLSHACSTRRPVRYSPYRLISFPLRPRKV